MITLIHAVRLCQLDDSEIVWLRPKGARRIESSLLSVKNMKRRLNMRAVKVLHIDVDFGYDGEWNGWEFEVTGITPEELHKVSLKSI